MSLPAPAPARSVSDPDAIVIGAGINGLTAAVLLADAGWNVVVLEGQDTPGGACRSGEVTAPGFVSDLFSAFYPLGAASPVLNDMRLDRFGMRWAHAPLVLGYALPDQAAALLSRDPAVTAASVEQSGRGDGSAWLRQFALWERIRGPLLDALFSPFPPVRPALRLGRSLGAADALRMARFATLPVRRFAEEEFRGSGAGLLLAGNALHTDLGPDSAASAVFGWLLCMLGQDVGFPVPEGGAGTLTAALVQRLLSTGAQLRTSCRVEQIEVEGGRAIGVRTSDGEVLRAARAVIADVDAPQLYRTLLDPELLPSRLRADLDRFQWDNSTFKVDWALSGPIPWADASLAGAGTVHLGGSMDDLSVTSNQLARRLVPEHPFVILGQMTTSDPRRSPAGTESAWAYLHVPQRPVGDAAGPSTPGAGITGRWDDGDSQRLTERMEAVIEAAAPGFRDLILARYVQHPGSLQNADAALHRGALNGGTASLHQQLVFRPVPGTGGADTVVPGLYLASMSAHPGGGVHGAPGANAARAALRSVGILGPIRRAVVRGSMRAVYRPAAPVSPNTVQRETAQG